MKRIFFFLVTLLMASFSFAQDTLPSFSVKNLGYDRDDNPKIVISWFNNFDTLSQISIQTSHDSLKNYRTLISLTDPNAKMNGYADTKAPNDHMFYRLFVVKNNGQFFFTGAKRALLDTARAEVPIETVVVKKQPVPETKPSKEGKDGKENVEVKKPPVFVPSFYVYTNKDGYVYINLPDAEKQKYHLKFYEEDNTFLFEIKNLRQSGVTLDKTNFLHAGWFNFELYNDDKLVEKHKFYLGKEF